MAGHWKYGFDFQERDAGSCYIQLDRATEKLVSLMVVSSRGFLK